MGSSHLIDSGEHLAPEPISPDPGPLPPEILGVMIGRKSLPQAGTNPP